jgi:hypothetical protein
VKREEWRGKREEVIVGAIHESPENASSEILVLRLKSHLPLKGKANNWKGKNDDKKGKTDSEWKTENGQEQQDFANLGVEEK